jgi:hypothetical protein
MLTKFKEEKDGEAVALFKIPADVLAAYAKAIGQVFTEFGSNADKETSALNKSTTLELARKKADACLSAIKANDENQIKALGCQ